MDRREHLQQNSVLEVLNGQQGLVSYTILGEIGRGSSCIVYEGYYLNNVGDRRPVRIKECYPLSLKIVREADGRLVCENETAFSKKKEEFRDGFRLNNLLSADADLMNRTTNTVDLYEKNNTLYIVTAYVEGRELAFNKERSLKSVLTIAKSIATSVEAIHKEGFLYLDLKPSNVFVYRETDELVQLFDFDSPVPMDFLQYGDGGNIAKTRGFAPLELIQGNVRKIGPWTDVYSLGAVVYTLLFGSTPSVRESDEDAFFDYANSIFRPEQYPYRMEILLTEFLHRTLAGYYRDRYQSMEEAKNALEEMLTFASPDALFIHSTRISEPVSMIGREKELQEIRKWWADSSKRQLYVTGMGGIGKSTLVRKAITGQNHEEQPDHLLFLSVAGRIQSIVADDSCVAIHGISRLKEESEADYFERKVSVLKTLGLSKSNLLILDDFEGEIDADVQALLDMGWKTMILSRENRYKEFFRHLPIGPLDSEEEQRQLFEQNLGRSLAEREEADFQRIRSLVQGHTLILELLGRQIRCSFFSLMEAADLVEKQGFSMVSEEKIDFARNQHFQYDSIRGIIQELFARNRLSDSERVVLKEVTLFYLSGLEIEEAGPDCNKDREAEGPDCNRDRLEIGRELEKQGWLTSDGQVFRMHPLIYEVVDAWEWQNPECMRAEAIMEAQSHKLRKQQVSVSERLSALYRTEQILYTASHAKELQTKDCFLRLAGIAVGKMPPDREEFILHYGEELLKSSHPGREMLTVREWMGITDMVSCILLHQKKFKEAKKILHLAKKLAGRDPYAKALYYDQLAAYYDEILEGQYDPAYKNPALAKLIDAEEKRIQWMNKADTEDSEIKTVDYMSQLALLLFRSYPEKKQMLQKRLYEMKGNFDALECKNPDIEYTFAATMGWYYTYVMPDSRRMDRWMERCRKYAEQVYLSDLDLIDYYFVPYANMKLECDFEVARSAELLSEAIQICDRHSDISVYQRKKAEVQGYLDSLIEYQNTEK